MSMINRINKHPDIVFVKFYFIKLTKHIIGIDSAVIGGSLPAGRENALTWGGLSNYELDWEKSVPISRDHSSYRKRAESRI